MLYGQGWATWTQHQCHHGKHCQPLNGCCIPQVSSLLPHTWSKDVKLKARRAEWGGMNSYLFFKFILLSPSVLPELGTWNSWCVFKSHWPHCCLMRTYLYVFSGHRPWWREHFWHFWFIGESSKYQQAGTRGVSPVFRLMPKIYVGVLQKPQHPFQWGPMYGIFFFYLICLNDTWLVKTWEQTIVPVCGKRTSFIFLLLPPHPGTFQSSKSDACFHSLIFE